MEEHFNSKEIAARFAELPKIVQDAITSAQIEKHMREIARAHQLHLDLWGALENQVMLTVMGLERAEDLVDNITRAIHVDAQTASSIAADISRIVFNPVRVELEHHLAEIEAPAAADSADATQEPVPTETSSQYVASVSDLAPIAPIAPPATAPETKSRRAVLSESYVSGVTSTERKEVHDDPYREPPA